MFHIRVENLTYSYFNEKFSYPKAINNISLNIKKGEFIGLIGKTGSGKSTFVKHLNALLKPQKGKIFLNDKDIWENSKKISNIRFKVGLVFQYPEHQLFEETVYKDISFGPKNMNLSHEEIDQKVYDACNFVNLNFDLLKKSPFELSGGEKRKVAIAGIIAMNPEVLILDEPTAGLDSKQKKQLLEKIKKYNKLKEKTIILISHNMEDIAEYADKVIVLDEGNLIMFDSTKKVFSQIDVLKKIGLDIPQIIDIMSEINKFIPNLNSNILTVDQAINEVLKFIKVRSK